MRPTFIHVLTGLLLGTALAGLLNVPGQIVAHQESVPPVHSPLPSKPSRETVVRISPQVERALVQEQARRSKPKPKARVAPVTSRDAAAAAAGCGAPRSGSEARRDAEAAAAAAATAGPASSASSGAA